MSFTCYTCYARKIYDVSKLSKSVIARNLRNGMVHGPNGAHALDLTP